MKNSEHSNNVFILKMLLKEYNRLLNEIKSEKNQLSYLFGFKKFVDENFPPRNENKITNLAMKKVHFTVLKRRRKEINIVANAIKVQKANIKRSNNK